MKKVIQDEFNPRNFFKSFFGIATGVLFSPKLFFGGMRRRGGLTNPLVFLVCCLLVHTLLVGLLRKSPGVILWGLFTGVSFPFLTSGIVFLIIRQVFKAHGAYEAAFRIIAYASAVNLISWLPMSWIIMEVYRVYLMVVGISIVFSLKASRAFLAIILTMALYVLAFAAFTHFKGDPLDTAERQSGLSKISFSAASFDSVAKKA